MTYTFTYTVNTHSFIEYQGQIVITNITYTVGNVTPLLPNTVYRFRLKTSTCYSVELLVRTLNE